MALINCPECGKEISSHSEKCNYCGCSISQEDGARAENLSSIDTDSIKVNFQPDGEAATGQPGPEVEVKSKPPKSRWKTIVAAVLCLVVLIGVIGNGVLKRGTDSVTFWQQSEAAKSAEGIDEYWTIYYSRGSHVIQELLIELFISKDICDPNIQNPSLSDFGYVTMFQTDSSYENIQDLGDYYLLTLDYTDLGDGENLKEKLPTGLVYIVGDGALEADSFIEQMKEAGAIEGIPSDKEYAAYFGSGRKENQNSKK